MRFRRATARLFDRAAVSISTAAQASRPQFEPGKSP